MDEHELEEHGKRVHADRDEEGSVAMKNLNSTEITWVHPFLDVLLHFVPSSARTILDVGCGKGIVGALLRIYREPERTVGLDAFEPYLEFCRKSGSYDELIKHDLMEKSLPFDSDEFDMATALEVIEHLPKAEGIRMLEELERVSRRVVVSTPNRFFEQETYDDNRFQKHLSRWKVSDFVRRGYSVYGVGGLMVFGRELGPLSYILSRATLPFPKLSSTLLAIYPREARFRRHRD